MQTILFFLYYEVLLIFLFFMQFHLSCYISILLQRNLFEDAWKFNFVTSVTINITSEVFLCGGRYWLTEVPNIAKVLIFVNLKKKVLNLQYAHFLK
jgi:hypothetical protein